MSETPHPPPEDVRPVAADAAEPVPDGSAVALNPVPASLRGVDREPEPEPAIEPPAEPEPEPEPPPPPPPPTVQQLATQAAELTLAVETAQRRADELLSMARRQTEIADELHAENRRLRGGEVREAVAPLVRGLARLADDLARVRSTPEHDSDDLAYLQSQVEELLHDAGVLVMTTEPGEPFDSRLHSGIATAVTDDPALKGTIAEVRRTGLRRDDGRMLRPIDVVVYRYVASPAPLPEPEARPETGEERPPDAEAEQPPPDEEGS